MELATLYRRSVSDFVDRAERIGPEQWSAPTPCQNWTVRELLNHIVSEDRWMVPLFAGQAIEEVGDRFDGDVLGSDPVGNAVEAAKQAEAAVSEPGAMERTVQLSFGPTQAREYVEQMLAENLVHTWDLAAATGTDRRLDPESVHECTQWFIDREELYRQSGGIGARLSVPENATDQDRLLAAFGRDPGWSPPA